MKRVTYIIPEGVFHHNFQGSYKDVIGRVEFFERTLGESFGKITVTDDNPSQIATRLREIEPTHVLIEYSYLRKITQYVRKTLPNCFLAVRANNIEPLQHFDNYGFRPLNRLPWLLYGMARLFLSDLTVARVADAIYPSNEWEARVYWSRIPRSAAVEWLPYFAPDSFIGKDSGKGKSNVIACLPGRVSHRRNREMMIAFINFAKLTKRIDPRYRFVVTGDMNGLNFDVPDFIELPGMLKDLGAFLAKAKAIAMLSPLGYGFKTTVVDALANSCYPLLHHSWHSRMPGALKQHCISVNPQSDKSVIAALDRLGSLSLPKGINDELKKMAYTTLRRDFGIN